MNPIAVVQLKFSEDFMPKLLIFPDQDLQKLVQDFCEMNKLQIYEEDIVNGINREIKSRHNLFYKRQQLYSEEKKSTIQLLGKQLDKVLMKECTFSPNNRTISQIISIEPLKSKERSIKRLKKCSYYQDAPSEFSPHINKDKSTNAVTSPFSERLFIKQIKQKDHNLRHLDDNDMRPKVPQIAFTPKLKRQESRYDQIKIIESNDGFFLKEKKHQILNQNKDKSIIDTQSKLSKLLNHVYTKYSFKEFNERIIQQLKFIAREFNSSGSNLIQLDKIDYSLIASSVVEVLLKLIDTFNLSLSLQMTEDELLILLLCAANDYVDRQQLTHQLKDIVLLNIQEKQKDLIIRDSVIETLPSRYKKYFDK